MHFLFIYRQDCRRQTLWLNLLKRERKRRRKVLQHQPLVSES
jgi:hypothetical protein